MPKYTITIAGDGGEFIAGEVTKEFYDSLEENGISIEDYAEGDEEDEQFECIPEDVRPFEPGGWFNISPYLMHMNQCDIGRMELTVTDEEYNTVYEGGQFGDDEHIHNNWTEDEVAEVEGRVASFSIYDPGSIYDGKCMYTCQRHENGMFFEGEIELDEPFNPKYLSLLTVNLNELDMITRVFYYPEGLDDNDNPVGEGIEIENECEGADEVTGATHELMLLG